MNKFCIYLMFFNLTYILETYEAGAHSCNSLNQLDRFLGNWIQEGDDGATTEKWKKVSDFSFEGIGKTLDRFGNETSNETLRLVEMSGNIFYIAKVSHNELPIAFKLIECDTQTFIFENKHHDFPQMLTYKFMSEDNLSVNVSAENERGFKLNFKRTQSEN